MARDMALGIKISRNYGTHQIEVALSQSFLIENADHYQSELKQLQKMAWAAISIYERDELPNIKGSIMPQVNNIAQDVKGVTERTEVIPVVYIDISFTDGKKRFKVGGGRFMKFGVALYLDTCKSDIELDAMPMGKWGQEENNLTATILLQGDKPVRVLSINHA